MINLEEAEKADMVITMGCDVEKACPLPLFKERAVDWNLDNPKGKPLEKYRQIREMK
jgi:protein-tyrosine-phosphatase